MVRNSFYDKESEDLVLLRLPYDNAVAIFYNTADKIFAKAEEARKTRDENEKIMIKMAEMYGQEIIKNKNQLTSLMQESFLN